MYMFIAFLVGAGAGFFMHDMVMAKVVALKAAIVNKL